MVFVSTVHDFGDRTALPGLVDAHCHLSLLGAGLTYEQEVQASDEFMAVAAVYNAQVMLRSGVTTLRSITTCGFPANTPRAARTAAPLASSINPLHPSS